MIGYPLTVQTLQVKLDKDDVGWDLLELEQAAHLVLEEETLKKQEETPTMPEQPDSMLEQLTSHLKKIDISATAVTDHSTEFVTEKTNLSTETDTTLLQGIHSDGYQAKEDSKLPTIRLSSSNVPLVGSSPAEKPLIEEMDQKPVEDTSSGSSSCSSGSESDSESTASSSDKEDTESSNSSKTAKSTHNEQVKRDN